MPVKRYPLAKQSVELMQDGNVEMIALSDVPHNQMPLYLNACDVLLLTSLHEGSPTIIKEALACNLPIVSTNVGDVGERVRTVEGCIVCEDDQPETIAEGLRKVLTLGHRIDGRRSVLELDEQIMTQKLSSVYRAALHGK